MSKGKTKLYNNHPYYKHNTTLIMRRQTLSFAASFIFCSICTFLLFKSRGVSAYTLSLQLLRKYPITSLRRFASKASESTFEKDREKKWNTGKIFASSGRNKLRNETPWWMKEEIDRHPSALPSYEPWWAMNPEVINDDWGLEEIQNEASKRGISIEGSKAELIEKLNSALKRNSLADDNFTAPTITAEDCSAFPSCYPEFYELSENGG